MGSAGERSPVIEDALELGQGDARQSECGDGVSPTGGGGGRGFSRGADAHGFTRECGGGGGKRASHCVGEAVRGVSSEEMAVARHVLHEDLSGKSVPNSIRSLRESAPAGSRHPALTAFALRIRIQVAQVVSEIFNNKSIYQRPLTNNIILKRRFFPNCF